jgi:F0F1-type ATP synthase alpha subunit
MRLDLAQPLTQGNVILFKGNKNLGKTRLAISAINQFLQADENNRAIYVGLSKITSAKAFDKLQADLQKRAAFFTVGGEDTAISDAEYILAPYLALQTAQAYLREEDGKTTSKNLLFVFDDVLLHHFKERHVFDLANQPFSPINIYN